MPNLPLRAENLKPTFLGKTFRHSVAHIREGTHGETHAYTYRSEDGSELYIEAGNQGAGNRLSAEVQHRNLWLTIASKDRDLPIRDLVVAVESNLADITPHTRVAVQSHRDSIQIPTKEELKHRQEVLAHPSRKKLFHD